MWQLWPSTCQEISTSNMPLLGQAQISCRKTLIMRQTVAEMTRKDVSEARKPLGASDMVVLEATGNRCT
jgi:hypothetical protein